MACVMKAFNHFLRVVNSWAAQVEHMSMFSFMQECSLSLFADLRYRLCSAGQCLCFLLDWTAKVLKFQVRVCEEKCSLTFYDHLVFCFYCSLTLSLHALEPFLCFVDYRTCFLTKKKRKSSWCNYLHLCFRYLKSKNQMAFVFVGVDRNRAPTKYELHTYHDWRNIVIAHRFIPDATQPIPRSQFLDVSKNIINMDSIVPRKYLGKESFGWSLSKRKFGSLRVPRARCLRLDSRASSALLALALENEGCRSMDHWSYQSERSQCWRAMKASISTSVSSKWYFSNSLHGDAACQRMCNQKQRWKVCLRYSLFLIIGQH